MHRSKVKYDALNGRIYLKDGRVLRRDQLGNPVLAKCMDPMLLLLCLREGGYMDEKDLLEVNLSGE